MLRAALRDEMGQDKNVLAPYQAMAKVLCCPSFVLSSRRVSPSPTTQFNKNGLNLLFSFFPARDLPRNLWRGTRKSHSKEPCAH